MWCSLAGLLIASLAVIWIAGCGERPPRVSYELEAGPSTAQVTLPEVSFGQAAVQVVTPDVSTEVRAKERIRVMIPLRALPPATLPSIVTLLWIRQGDTAKLPKRYGGASCEVNAEGDRATVNKVIETPNYAGSFELCIHSQGQCIAKAPVTVK
jgi:hypothetical protein